MQLDPKFMNPYDLKLVKIFEGILTWIQKTRRQHLPTIHSKFKYHDELAEQHEIAQYEVSLYTAPWNHSSAMEADYPPKC